MEISPQLLCMGFYDAGETGNPKEEGGRLFSDETSMEEYQRGSGGEISGVQGQESLSWSVFV